MGEVCSGREGAGQCGFSLKKGTGFHWGNREGPHRLLKLKVLKASKGTSGRERELITL